MNSSQPFSVVPLPKEQRGNRPGSFAWGVPDSAGGLLARVETCPDEDGHRLFLTELWVKETHRRQGIGRALLDVAKEQTVLEHRRALVVSVPLDGETEAFFRAEGFHTDGGGMVWTFRKERSEAETLVIRQETSQDYRSAEEMTLAAFWNKYRQGCDEHLLVHKLRGFDKYLPGLSRVALSGETVVGAIYYSRALLENNGRTKEVLTFGPLCVDPYWQGCGVGERLLKETLPLAKDLGFPGIVIFGEPDYYPRLGFRTCDRFGITTEDGGNFDAFQGIELFPGALSGFGGRFLEDEFFHDLPEAENEAFTATFRTRPKQKFPGQWE